jgi:hypothetical protein
VERSLKSRWAEKDLVYLLDFDAFFFLKKGQVGQHSSALLQQREHCQNAGGTRSWRSGELGQRSGIQQERKTKSCLIFFAFFSGQYAFACCVCFWRPCCCRCASLCGRRYCLGFSFSFSFSFLFFSFSCSFSRFQI